MDTAPNLLIPGASASLVHFCKVLSTPWRIIPPFNLSSLKQSVPHWSFAPCKDYILGFLLVMKAQTPAEVKWRSHQSGRTYSDSHFRKIPPGCWEMDEKRRQVMGIRRGPGRSNEVGPRWTHQRESPDPDWSAATSTEPTAPTLLV